MPDKCVLDSNVIAAFFFLEEASLKAEALIKEIDIVTIDLAFAEIANVAWKKICLFNENKSDIEEALILCIQFIKTSCEVIDASELMDHSFKIALEEKLTIYDSLFIAAAERENLPLYTLDKKMKVNNSVHLL